MSVAHWGEPGIGNWTVVVKDGVVNEHTGNFVDWKLRLWGEAIDGANQPLLPMPGAHDDDDHDKTITTTGHVTTTSVSHPTGTTDPGDKSTHTPDRPVNVKPTSTPASESSMISSALASPTSPSATTQPTDASTSSSLPSALPTSEPEKQQDNDTFLPSPFPTFGVSKRTQIWIYASLSLIVVFCASLGTYLFLARRRRLRNDPREAYEFTELNEQEGMLENGGAGAGGKRKGRRAGELYDAFANESEEELFSDEEDDRGYRDDDEARGEGHDEKASGHR
ncbi:hypothetical protein LTS18_013865 [Coniosporium uncinatum]|uniref:Uncharacterized protein n=1 Tax=Coniosporium uncinatum TaxID=93489 RepID=A0ACC3DHZ4_9PEZI|nr:hypothetical protein LTS18_013865 [Coniosporium uncinatum]